MLTEQLYSSLLLDEDRNNALGRIHRDEKVISYYCSNRGSIFASYLRKTLNHKGAVRQCSDSNL